MANKKISDLTSNPTPALTDLLEIEAPGVGSFKETANALAVLYQAAFGAGGSLPLAGYGTVTSVGLAFSGALPWLAGASTITTAGTFTLGVAGGQTAAQVLATNPTTASTVILRALTNKHLASAGADASNPGAVQLAGDLGGTAASPLVAALQGITLSATPPTSGQVLTASSAGAAGWANAAGGVSNPLTLTAATGVSAQILAAGTDTNIPLLLVPKGSGQVRLFSDTYAPGIGLFCGTSPPGLQVQQAGSTNLADLIARTLFAGNAATPPATLGYSGHGLDLAADKMVQWSNTTGDATQAKDTLLSRSAAGVFSLDTTAAGNHAGWYNYGGTSRVAADLTNATATMAAITGLSATLQAGRFYLVRMVVKAVNSQATEGVQFDFNGGTATATAFWMGAGIFASGGTDVIGTNIATSLASAITFTTFTGESVIVFEGYIQVNAAGTLIPRFAENTSAAGTATVRKGAFMVLVDTP